LPELTNWSVPPLLIVRPPPPSLASASMFSVPVLEIVVPLKAVF